MEGDLLYLAAIGSFTKFGPKRLALLMCQFESPKAIWQASAAVLTQHSLPEAVAAEFISHRTKTSPEKIWQALQEQQ